MRFVHRPAFNLVDTIDKWEHVEKDTTVALTADIIIPGRGDPLKDGAIVITEGVIEWIGNKADVPAKYSSLHFNHQPVLMPGMWDVHTHFMGAGVVAPLVDFAAQFMPNSEAQIGAVTPFDLKRTLDAGFTSVRELGGFAGAIHPLVEKDFIQGPTVYSAFSILSITGGHGDVHELPLETVESSTRIGHSLFAICDGVAACQRMVRQQIRRGAKVIKVCSTGGVLSLNDQPEDAQFSPAELEAIVQEAARSRRLVAAHAIGKEGIINALNAGIKSIEHGMYLDEEVAALMKEKDAIYVPTRHIVETLNAEPDQLPPKLLTKARRMRDLSRQALKIAIKEGVKVALGTDTASSDPKDRLTHGNNAAELYWAVKAGMTPLQAIEMATATPPETLGAQAPKVGQLKEGYVADIIAIAKNPLDDIEVLTKPSNITHVWKSGKLYKSP
jgi:imidazolonepropionase-like amidohydrolase